MALIYERSDDNFDFPNSDSARFNCGRLDNKMGQDEPAAAPRRRRRAGNVWATRIGGRGGGGRWRLREIPVEALKLAVKPPAPFMEEGAKNGHYFSLHSPPSTIKSSPDNCSGLNRD